MGARSSHVTTSSEPPLDLERILDALDRHKVNYLVVGGTAANAYGATRITKDFDCIPERTSENLARLAAAMRELNARLRVEGLTDAECQALPTPIDGFSLRQLAISTWRTDAGDFDVLADIPGQDGRLLGFEELALRAAIVDVGGVAIRIAALGDVIASKEHADRPKDREALPELRAIYQRDVAQRHLPNDP